MQEPVFNYGVLGAGAIGCYTGGWLALDAPVLLIGRPRYMDGIQSSGLRLENADGKRALLAGRAFSSDGKNESLADLAHNTVFTSTTASALQHCRVIMVSVKSAATSEAAETIAKYARPGVPIISLQNGLHAARTLRKKLPDFQVIAGMVTYNVIHDAGLFQQSTTGPVILEESAVSGKVCRDLQAAGISAEQRSDMESVQWSKLLLNLNNPVNALAGVPIRSMLSDPGYRQIIADAMKEALDVYKAAGVKTVRLGKIIPGIAPFVLGLPDFLFFRVASTMINIDPTAMTSLAQDLMDGRKTEVDYLNGEIVRLAESNGKKAPVNKGLCDLVHEAEKLGGTPYMSAEKLTSALKRG